MIFSLLCGALNINLVILIHILSYAPQFTCAIPVLYSICPEILSPLDKLLQLYLIEDKYEGNEVENICIFPQSGVLTISQNVLPAHTWVSFCRTGKMPVFLSLFWYGKRP